MICPECQYPNIENANYCVNCGYKLNSEYHYGPYDNFDQNFSMALRKFRFRDLFSNIFKKHTNGDVELLFTIGTPTTAPDIHDGQDVWPRPWLFARILVTVLLLYLGFYIGLIYFENLNFLPGLIMLGAFLTPVSILIFFWEINVPSNISLYRVIIFFLVGGLVSLLYSVLLYSVIDGLAFPLVTGIVEETAKLLALLIFASKRRYTYILNGLLIGAAIGTGFAAFESSGYILLTALQYGVRTMLRTIFWRAILAPGGHIAWAGLTGAAVMMVKNNQKFRLTNLFNFKFIRIFVLVILLHSLWDTNIPQPFLPQIPLYPIILTVISWVALFWTIRKGINQISDKKALQYQTRRV
jgi:RsiW-degrading membrane proteinase PrsW (M82 family)